MLCSATADLSGFTYLVVSVVSV